MVAKIEFGACARVRLCAPSNVDASALTRKKNKLQQFLCVFLSSEISTLKKTSRQKCVRARGFLCLLITCGFERMTTKLSENASLSCSQVCKLITSIEYVSFLLFDRKSISKFLIQKNFSF